MGGARGVTVTVAVTGVDVTGALTVLAGSEADKRGVELAEEVAVVGGCSQRQWVREWECVFV
jgi:hypothetical protein